MISANLLAIFYLISGILFILALRGLSSPETSRQGNLFGIIGMAIAITVTFLSIDNFSSGLKLFSCIGMFVIFTYSKPFIDKQIHGCEYCILCLTALLGIMLLLVIWVRLS